MQQRYPRLAAENQRSDMPTSTPVLSILIVSHNTRDLIVACIRSVFKQTMQTEFDVIVVDNASTDGSADAIADEFPQVRLIRSAENLGFGRANNLAAEGARGDLILLLNPDTVVLDHAIDRLVAFARANPEALIWGGRTLFADRTLNPWSCWRFMSLWSLVALAAGLTAARPESPIFNPEAYGGWQRDTVRQVEMVSGCFFMIDRTLWAALGGFDPRYFMYAEEADLCWRAREIGARPMVTPRATIVHHIGASEPDRPVREIRILTGKVTFLRKHWSVPSRSIGVALFKLHVLGQAAAHSALSLITRSERHRANAALWREIWAARTHWTKGYPSETRVDCQPVLIPPGSSA